MSKGLIKCLSCAAILQPDDSKKYLECEYCGTHNANFSKFEVLDFKITNDGSEDLSDLEKLAVHLSHQDYDVLRNNASIFLKDHPKSWIAMVYKAIGEFWTGHKDFSHLNDVTNLLNRALEISNRNEFVLNAFDRVANNCLILCAKHKNPYGEDLKQSLIIFDYFYSDNIDESNKKLVIGYCSEAYQKYKKDLDKLFASSTSSYDPPYNAVNNLYYLASITELSEIEEYYYIQTSHHIAQNQTKSYIDDLNKKFNTIKVKLESKVIDLPKVKIVKYTNKEGCFVITAAYGNENHPIVLDFRKYRDIHIKGKRWGDFFITKYYKYGPYLANIISKNLMLKFLILHIILTPIHKIIKRRIV